MHSFVVCFVRRVIILCINWHRLHLTSCHVFLTETPAIAITDEDDALELAVTASRPTTDVGVNHFHDLLFMTHLQTASSFQLYLVMCNQYYIKLNDKATLGYQLVVFNHCNQWL